jgi:hypothetical protein
VEGLIGVDGNARRLPTGFLLFGLVAKKQNAFALKCTNSHVDA